MRMIIPITKLSCVLLIPLPHIFVYSIIFYARSPTWRRWYQRTVCSVWLGLSFLWYEWWMVGCPPTQGVIHNHAASLCHLQSRYHLIVKAGLHLHQRPRSIYLLALAPCISFDLSFMRSFGLEMYPYRAFISQVVGFVWLSLALIYQIRDIIAPRWEVVTDDFDERKP